MTKLVKEKLYEDSSDEQEYIDDDEENDNEENEENEGDGVKGVSFGKEKALALVQKYLPFIGEVSFDEDPSRDNPNSWNGLDEVYCVWDTLSCEHPEIEDTYGFTLVIGVVKGEATPEDYTDDDVTVKFYVDSVAFVGSNSDDEYNDWVNGESITAFDEDEWEATIESMKESGYGINDEDEGDFQQGMITR
jgi:hypothetical protein